MNRHGFSDAVWCVSWYPICDVSCRRICDVSCHPIYDASFPICAISCASYGSLPRAYPPLSSSLSMSSCLSWLTWWR